MKRFVIRQNIEHYRAMLTVTTDPAQRVQIEVLLFEKKVSNSNNFGLNLLRLGDGAKNLIKTGLTWGGGGARRAGQTAKPLPSLLAPDRGPAPRWQGRLEGPAAAPGRRGHCGRAGEVSLYSRIPSHPG